MAIQSHKKNAERAADAIFVGGGAMAKAPAEALAAEGSLRGQKSVHHVSVFVRVVFVWHGQGNQTSIVF